MTKITAGPARESTWQTLEKEHEIIDALCADLVARAECGEWKMCDAIWDGFVKRLEAHMDLEERELFPRFVKMHPENEFFVSRLEAEHLEIRVALQHMGLTIQLHELREANMRSLVAHLRRHVEKEARAFYPWVAAQGRDAQPNPATDR